jgi:hypothetical protein
VRLGKMKEIIADLTSIDEEHPEDILPDSGIVQQVENALLDLVGNIVRIRITKVRDISLGVLRKIERC